MKNFILPDDHGLPVDSPPPNLYRSAAFARFQEQFRHDLRRLVARWAPYAAPAARGRRPPAWSIRKGSPPKPR
ncbi:MAG: hypothetical protein GTO03_01810 [Planctomycetales bacterium]|nr:hypothetical protein [Planctomycetales bacterium]